MRRNCKLLKVQIKIEYVKSYILFWPCSSIPFFSNQNPCSSPQKTLFYWKTTILSLFCRRWRTGRISFSVWLIRSVKIPFSLYLAWKLFDFFAIVTAPVSYFERCVFSKSGISCCKRSFYSCRQLKRIHLGRLWINFDKKNSSILISPYSLAAVA